MSLKLTTVAVLAVLLASCSSVSDVSDQEQAALQEAKTSFEAVKAATDDFNDVRRFLLRKPVSFGPRGSAALERVTEALTAVEIRTKTAFVKLRGGPAYSVDGLVGLVWVNARAVNEAWAVMVPTLRAALREHISPVRVEPLRAFDAALNLFNHTLRVAAHEVDRQLCEGSRGDWDAENWECL